MLGLLTRTFGYLYHVVLGLFLLVVGAIGLYSPGSRLEIPTLPWADSTPGWAPLLCGLAGLGFLTLAVTGRPRLPFRLWTVFVFSLMAYCYFFSGYPIGISVTNVVLLLLGALIAVLGSWSSGRKRLA